MKKMGCLLLACLLLVSMAALPVAATDVRTWTTSDAGFSASGFTVGSNGTAVSTTNGAYVQWVIPEESAGEARAAVYLTKGSTAEAQVKSGGISQTLDLQAPSDGWYELGSYLFSGGDTVRIVNRGTTGVSALRAEPREVVILDTTMLSKMEGFSKSGAPGFSSAPGYYAGNSSSVAEWKVPQSVSGATDVYYYVPNVNKTGYADMSVRLTVSDGDKQSRVFDITGSKVPAGWMKVGTLQFSGSGAETFSVRKINGVSGSARLYGVKLVSNAYESFFVTPDSFLSTGEWQREGFETAFEERILRHYIHDGSGNAICKVEDIPNGNYYVYVDSCDYSNYSTATRLFQFLLNGVAYRKNASGKQQYFGTHQYPGTNDGTDKNANPVFQWEQAAYPYKTVAVTDGVLEIQVAAVDSSYGRLDGILITQDPLYNLEAIEKEAAKAKRVAVRSIYEEELAYPESYKGSLASVAKTAKLSNDRVTVSFRQGVLESGNTAVQRETVTDGVITNAYESGLGFLSLRADKALRKQSGGYYGNFNTSYLNKDGQPYKVTTGNVFNAGVPEWLIPTTLEQVSANSVRMTAVGENANITALWTLEDGDLEPKVDVSVQVKKDGEYTFGFFNDVNEIDTSKVGYVLNPFRWQEMRLPKPGQLLRESHSTTSHTQMTYKMNDAGQEITLGVAADQSSIVPGRWTHDVALIERTDNNGNPAILDYTDEQSNFAMNTTGNGGGVLPAVFAPLLCSEDSTFKAGQTYSFSYRPLATVSTEGENQGWYACYKHVAQDLRGIYDYRDNYYDSMTNTVFNFYNLLMDDFAGGWDKDLVGNYNIEDTYWVTNSNGLAYLQFYMLTEDKDMLMNRTLPIMGTLLTRNSSHFNSQYSYRDRVEGPINKALTTTNFTGNSTYEGAYLMSRGQMPVYRNIAKSRFMNTNVESAGKGIKNPSEGLWYDRAAGNTSLPTMTDLAQNYAKNRAFETATNPLDEELFINISYTPHIQSQVDVYEATGDETYLKGAVEAARRFLPSLRASDMPESKTNMRVADVEQLDAEARIYNKSTWWWLGTGYRRGALMRDMEDNTNNGSVYQRKAVIGREEGTLWPDETPYPEWVTSRVGLGLEQFSTCADRNSSIFMSTWAGDVLRLGYLSNDELMMDMARSSIVGRFSNYPGYYISDYNPVPGYKDYPILGFDSTSLYFHHIPVQLASLQDYLFSNAWVKSDGKVDFPNTRSQGYAWFNNRQYGHEPGVIYNETGMWPWLKEGTITVSSKQIDWIAGRKDGRAAFVLTNAGDAEETITVNFNADLGIENGSRATVYNKEGIATTADVSNNQMTVTVPKKGILTIAVNGSGIKAPAYSRIDFNPESDGKDLDMGNSAMGLMYKGNTYNASVGYDVKAYALALDPDSYMGYVFVGGRSTEPLGGDGEKGIVKTTLTWRFADETDYKTETDDSFPYEFFIPVTDPKREIVFNVTTEFKNGTKTLDKEYTISKYPVQELSDVTKTNFEPVSLSILQAAGSVTAPLTKGRSKYCIAYNNLDKIPIDVTAPDALKGCYLNGYLVAKDLSGTDIVEKGYVLFNNVEIVNSAINASQKNRFDFSVSDIALMASNNACEEYDENGNYLGVKQGVINVTKGALATYDWSNLYITNSKTQKDIQVAREDDVYTISCNTAEYCYVIKATYNEAGRMLDVSVEDAIISVNNPKIVPVEKNQKVFVWANKMYQGTNMQPLINELQ